ncbi:hypothetical protein ACQ4PT_014319 [Festuca glaucescens]
MRRLQQALRGTQIGRPEDHCFHCWPSPFSSCQDMNPARLAPRPIPFHLLEEITDGFSEERKLGAGAYGSVYMGQHKDGEVIAVKKLHSMPELNDQQFHKEYLNVANLNHPNIVQWKWRNRLKGASTDEIDSCAELVKTCMKIALNCVDADRHKRPTIGDIIRELDQMEIMTQFSQALTINPGLTSLDVQNISRHFPLNLPQQEQSGLLEVHPCQLRFPFFAPNKSICPLRLNNNTDSGVAFRIIPENYVDGVNGIVPPRSTQTCCLLMEKQPPANMTEFVVTLESCIAHVDIEDVDDNFLQEVLEVTPGNKVHKVTLMAATSEGGGVAIWNYETQERVISLQTLANKDSFRCTKFIAREHWFLAGDWNGWIHVRACDTTDEVTKFQAHNDVVISLAAHPSDPLLVSSSVDHIKLWNWEQNWKCIRKLKAHSGYVEKAVFNPKDDNIFASVGYDTNLKIWKTSSPLAATVLDCREIQLTLDYFHPGGDRQYIVTGSATGKARIWDVKTNTCIRQINELENNCRCVGVLNCFPDRELLLTSLEGNVISVYNFDTDGLFFFLQLRVLD